ncbi:MAG: phage holin family protein [Pseudomonadota bacterium]|nr:phage holin family protein [Pseudomonadota bacterium]
MPNITEQQAGSLSESTRSPQARIARVVREASGRIGKVAGEAASDIAVVVRDEVGRLAALFRPELLTVGKGLAALCVAALGGLLALGFANVALLGLLREILPLPWAALVLAVIWGAGALLCLRFARAQVRRLMDLKGTAREGPLPG